MHKTDVQRRRTERLTFRPVRPDDIDAMLVYRNDPRVYRWLLHTTVIPEQFRQRWLEKLHDPHDYSVVVERNGAFIGTGSLAVGDGIGQDEAPELRGCQAELGYTLDPAYAGNGYATEIARELLVMAFADLRLRRVIAGCYAENVASVRVLEKIGMRREQYGVRDSWHQEYGWRDGCTYALLRTEWDRQPSHG